MSKKEEIIELDCGIEATLSAKGKNLTVDLDYLWNGSWTFEQAEKLFSELHQKGWKNMGIYIKNGWYGDIDGLYLECVK